MEEYIGVLKFDEAIPCKREVSGSHLQTKIAGINVELVFPSLPEEYNFDVVDFENGDLKSPNNLFKGRVYWGTINRWPEGVFSVDAVICYILGELDDIDKIYQEFPKWKERVSKLLLINTGDYIIPEQKMPAIVRGAGFDDGLKLYLSKSGKSIEYVMNGRKMEPIQVKFVSEDESYSLAEIKELFLIAGEEEAISLSYELLIAAYRAMKRHDYRSAVILAGSAVERAIARRMRQEYVNADEYEIDLEKYRMLGGKFRWLNEKQVSIPVVNYRKDILNIRNEAAHEGKLPAYEVTKTCLEKARKLVEAYDVNILE